MKARTMHKKSTTYKSLFVITTALCFLMAAPLLFAQDQRGGQGQRGYEGYGQQGQQGQQKSRQQQKSYHLQQQQEKSFSDKKLEKFVAAYDEVSEIRNEYSEELQQTQDSSKAQELQSKYQGKMISAIKDNNLTVGDYNEVVQEMGVNPELKEKIDDLR